MVLGILLVALSSPGCAPGALDAPGSNVVDAPATASPPLETWTENPTACFATIFGAPGFAGSQACLPLGTFTRAELEERGFTDASVGSVTLNFGFRVTVATDSPGHRYETAAPDPAVAPISAGQVKSVTVENCVAGLFEDAHGHSNGTCLSPGVHDVRIERIRSVQVAPGYTLTLQRSDGTTATTDSLEFLSPPLSAPGSTILSATVAARETPAAAKPRALLALAAEKGGCGHTWRRCVRSPAWATSTTTR